MKQALRIVQDFIKSAAEKHLSVYAAGSAFFVILSIVPMFMLLNFLLPFTGLTEKNLLDALLPLFPSATIPFWEAVITQVNSGSKRMLPVTFIFAAWSSGRGMLSLIRGLNGIYGTSEHRGYFRLRVISSFYTIILLAGLVFVLVISVFGQSRLRFVPAAGILGIIFTLLYTYVPDRKLSIKNQYRWGFAAAIGCTIFSYCFSVYVDYYNDFSGYGSINIIIIIMLWLYFMMYILLYGAFAGSYKIY